jgi:Mg-dependent DNase
LPKDLKPKPKNNRNEPKHLNHILSAIAKELDISEDKLGNLTTNNFKVLFKV